MIQNENAEELWLKPTKSGKGFILEVRKRYILSKDGLRRLANGQIKGLKLSALVSENKEKATAPNTIKASPEDFL